jgi:hypothetical protein
MRDFQFEFTRTVEKPEEVGHVRLNPHVTTIRPEKTEGKGREEETNQSTNLS